MANDLRAPVAPNFTATPAVSVLIASVARKGLVALATLLISHGFLDPGASEALVSVGSGVILAIVAQGWSWWQSWREKKTTVELVVASLDLPKHSTIADLVKVVPAAAAIVKTATPTP